jgi:hypothetical protein
MPRNNTSHLRRKTRNPTMHASPTGTGCSDPLHPGVANRVPIIADLELAAIARLCLARRKLRGLEGRLFSHANSNSNAGRVPRSRRRDQQARGDLARARSAQLHGSTLGALLLHRCSALPVMDIASRRSTPKLPKLSPPMRWSTLRELPSRRSTGAAIARGPIIGWPTPRRGERFQQPSPQCALW